MNIDDLVQRRCNKKKHKIYDFQSLKQWDVLDFSSGVILAIFLH